MEPVSERGVIRKPDLVLVADDSLVGVPSAGVTDGLRASTTLFIVGAHAGSEWASRLNIESTVHCLAPPGGDIDPLHNRLLGAFCTGAAARLLGGLTFENVEQAIRDELTGFAPGLVSSNIHCARDAFDAMAAFEGSVCEGAPLHVHDHGISDWVELSAEDLAHGAPAIYGGATSVQVRTGLWRTIRPVIDYDRCRQCHWVCSNYCPDNAITVRADGYPEIDLEHCKGCMICVAQCPPHAIETIAERLAQEQEAS